MDRLDNARDRRAAWLLGVPSALFIAVILHHPTLGLARGASTADIVAGVSRVAFENAAFHAAVLLMLGAQAVGIWSFAERVVARGLRARAGAVLYAASIGLLVIAGSIDGFATPLIGRGCVGDLAGCAASVAASASTEFALIQALTRVGLCAQALAFAAWSLAFADKAPRRLAIGMAGLAVSLAPLAIMGMASGAIGPRLLAELIAPGCLWSMGAAWLLWRRTRAA